MNYLLKSQQVEKKNIRKSFSMNVTEIRRPAYMERITTSELAQAFIDE